MQLIRVIATVLLLASAHCYIEYTFYPIKEIFLVDEHVLFRFNLTNKYTTGLLFLTRGTPLDYIPGPILSLTKGGTAVTFMCPVAKRTPPSATDFEFLPVGDSISSLYNVSDCYAITAGNYSANTSTSLAAKLIYSVTADTNYEIDSFSSLDLFATYAFCVMSASEVCVLPSVRPNIVLNATLVSSGYSLLTSHTLLRAVWLIFCVVTNLMF